MKIPNKIAAAGLPFNAVQSSRSFTFLRFILLGLIMHCSVSICSVCNNIHHLARQCHSPFLSSHQCQGSFALTRSSYVALCPRSGPVHAKSTSCSIEKYKYSICSLHGCEGRSPYKGSAGLTPLEKIPSWDKR